MKSFVSTIIVAICIGIASAQSNYCTLCTNHIACNNPGTFAAACSPDASAVTLTDAQKAIIVDGHNDFRNKFAAGQIGTFKGATNMLKFSYDEELAKLALLNARQCQMKHDGCRDTATFAKAGQNLYSASSSASYPDVSASLTSAMTSWSKEYLLASQSDLDKCCGTNTIGHFTQMIQSVAYRVGCGVTLYQSGGWFRILVACNYSKTNMLNQPVYTSGATASACTKGKDATYKNLCVA